MKQAPVILSRGKVTNMGELVLFCLNQCVTTQNVYDYTDKLFTVCVGLSWLICFCHNILYVYI